LLTTTLLLSVLLLYVSVLTSQDKNAEALAALSGPHSSLFKLPHEKKKYIVNLLCQLEKWDEAHLLVKELLSTHEYAPLFSFFTPNLSSPLEDLMIGPIGLPTWIPYLSCRRNQKKKARRN